MSTLISAQNFLLFIPLVYTDINPIPLLLNSTNFGALVDEIYFNLKSEPKSPTAHQILNPSKPLP